ncbi:hypothetical protein [Methanobrevibacter sp. DSM 116169]|uniref:hypothetical protein n=1 Tax=Methanobrevibacter sp. DSM 116169 TaxID=3242727 RepID=UPI0038FC3F69
MNNEKDIIFLISLVALGIAIIAGTVGFLNAQFVLPLLLIGIILIIFILLAYKKNLSHFIENIEKIMFIVTLIIIVSSFILVYKPF